MLRAHLAAFVTKTGYGINRGEQSC